MSPVSASVAGLGEPRRVAVLRALHLGDLLCAIPAMRSLRALFPKASILLIGLPWARDFVRRFAGMLDGFLEFPGYPGLTDRPAQDALDFYRQAAALQLDLAVQMHDDGSITNGIVARLGARRAAGFRRKGAPPPACMDTIPWPDDGPEIRRLLSLAGHLGAPMCGEETLWPVTAEDIGELKASTPAGALRAGRYAVLVPGAREPARRWPPECFARIADRLAMSGLSIVLSGSAREIELTREVSLRMKAPALDLGGSLGPGGLGALLSDARLLLGNDTKVSHMAAALRVPSVIVYTVSDPGRWAPLDSTIHRRVVLQEADPDSRNPRHARPVEADLVWREVLSLLELEPA
ncbi:MAG: glycosyltransferase family 9 protein [Candidatus Polarisedimenticolia bacterium]